MDIEEQIRILIKEEIGKDIGDIKEQLSSLSSRLDHLERAQGSKWNLLLRWKKRTLDELMSEYDKIIEKKHRTPEEQAPT